MGNYDFFNGDVFKVSIVGLKGGHVPNQEGF